MIFQSAITHWRNAAPWPQDAQVEQDLILSRALVEIFQEALPAKALILRGGTALHKLYVKAPSRYSEDIDLVQASPGPIGPILDSLRKRLDPVLGSPQRELNPGNATLRYRMESEIPPQVPLRLKIEINTREHFTASGAISLPFSVASPWFSGQAQVRTYTINDLLATKLRALYQRRKGRDLFDLWLGLDLQGADPKKIVGLFKEYVAAEGGRIGRRAFDKNLREKAASRAFRADLAPLLAPSLSYDPGAAAERVLERLIARL